MKGQIYTLKEVLSFLLGVAITISLFFTFSNILKEKVSDYSIEEYLKDIAITVNAQIQNSFSILRKGSEKMNSTIELSLPARVSDFRYKIYFSDKDVCVEAIEKYEKNCQETPVSKEEINLKGIFHSTKRKMEIKAWKDGTSKEISIS